MTTAPLGLTATKSRPLSGTIMVPGDKSISHRSLLFGALATGKTIVQGLLESTDILATRDALCALGVPINKTDDKWEIIGRGIGGLTKPEQALDFGNAGTGVRLMMGVLAGQPFAAKLTGDESLSRRPMGRVLAPLKSMGLLITDTDSDRLPLTVEGTPDLIPIEYNLPVPSAQVKSAILLAGLHATGETTVIEDEPTRDHTERMLRYFGADISVKENADGRHITIVGETTLRGQQISVPGDPSSAAFIAAAALIVPDSDVTIENTLINPTRTGFFQTVQDMGADIQYMNERAEAGDRVADVQIRHSKLTGVTVPAERAPSMIDEYPVLAALSAFASGTTRMEGLAELRVKESDRLAATQSALQACGVNATIDADTLSVEGSATVRGDGLIKTHMDHRIAMSFLTLGLGTEAPVTIDDSRMIMTSFPNFTALMQSIGAKLTPAPEIAT